MPAGSTDQSAGGDVRRARHPLRTAESRGVVISHRVTGHLIRMLRTSASAEWTVNTIHFGCRFQRTPTQASEHTSSNTLEFPDPSASRTESNQQRESLPGSVTEQLALDLYPQPTDRRRQRETPIGSETSSGSNGGTEIDGARRRLESGTRSTVSTSAGAALLAAEERALRKDSSLAITIAEILDATPADLAGRVRVFSAEDVLRADRLLETCRPSDRERFRATLRTAIRHGGYRTLFPTDIELPALDKKFANFSEVLRFLNCELTCAARVKDPADAHIDPILLVGPPGVGKTHFARAVARALQLPFRVYSAGDAQEAMQLTGTDGAYSNSRPGLVFNLLAAYDSASAVLVIDEIEKISPYSSPGRDTPINSLLDLMEPSSAERYRDQCVQLQFDASKLLIICTANDTESIPAPLLSRLTRFDIPLPSQSQLRLIASEYFQSLKEKHHCRPELSLDPTDLEQITANGALDVRALVSMVRQAFGVAIREDSAVVRLRRKKAVCSRPRIGFT